MLQKSVEHFITQQNTLLHSRTLYCTVEHFTTQQKVKKSQLYSRKCRNVTLQKNAEDVIAQQKVKKSQSCGRKWKKVHFAVETKDKLTLQRLPLNFGLNVCTQTGSGRMVLWSPFRVALGPTSFLEKA